MFSIIIPCYNESKNIQSLVEAFEKLNLRKDELELILVQNGSTDNTAVMLEKFTVPVEYIQVVEVPVNQGYGYGIKQGLRVATGEFLGWMHADLQFSPEEILRVIEKQKELGILKNVMFKGLRRNRPVVDRGFTMCMALYETFLLRCWLYDINAQPTVFSRDIYDLWGENAPNDFSLDLFAYYMAKKNKCHLYRWPVKQHQRAAGESSWNTGMSARWKLIRRIVSYSRSMRRAIGI